MTIVDISRWLEEVTVDTVVRRQRDTVVSMEGVRLNPASIGSWLGSIDSHFLV